MAERFFATLSNVLEDLERALGIPLDLGAQVKCLVFAGLRFCRSVLEHQAILLVLTFAGERLVALQRIRTSPVRVA